MFKKFKDKLAEEMKPARLQASMQQLAQAVVSPALSNSSIYSTQDLSVSNDNFSLTEEGDETPKNSPARHGFQNVDLMTAPSNAVGVSRRSSISSVTSDTSSLFPIYESPQNLYHLQSDMDQSASEVDDNISPQLDRITKDQLYSAYRKVQTKYHKYRGRYTDLVGHYRELERAKSKVEALLVETQDKVLRRIADLKEQCQLEQQAKAHLEEALRNDIEEKDHIISTLNTKVKLLQTNGSGIENETPSKSTEEAQDSKGDLIDLSNQPSATENNDSLLLENTQLKEKLKKLDNVILKYKDSLKRNKEKFTEVMQEKNILDHDYEAFKSSSLDQINRLEKELSDANGKVSEVTEQINILKKREEESAISLAENKLSIHRELEGKEELIKQLQQDLKQAMESKEHLNETTMRYKAELEKLKLLHMQYSDGNKSVNLIKEESEQSHTDEKEQEKHQLMENNKEKVKPQKLSQDNSTASNTTNDSSITDSLKLALQKREDELQMLNVKLSEMQQVCETYQFEKEKLQTEISNLQIKYKDLKSEFDAQKIVMDEKVREAETLASKLQNTADGLNQEVETIRHILTEKEKECEALNAKVQEYTTVLEKVTQQSQVQKDEIKHLRSQSENDSEICKLQDELENRNVELLGLHSEIKSCKCTISDLREKIQVYNSDIHLLKEDKKRLIMNIARYKDCINKLSEDYKYLRNCMQDGLSDQKQEISSFGEKVNNFVSNLVINNETLKDQKEHLNHKLIELERVKSDLELELKDVRHSKLSLENELKSCQRDLKEMAAKIEEYDTLDFNNSKLIAEIDNLNFKIYDLEKLLSEMGEERAEINDLREKLKLLKEMEDKSQQLLNEINDLKKNAELGDQVNMHFGKLQKQYNEALSTIDLLQSENENYRMIEEKHKNLESVNKDLEGMIVNKEERLLSLDKQLVEQQELITDLKNKCKKQLVEIAELNTFKQEYQRLSEEHSKLLKDFNEISKTTQETIDTKNVKLNELETVNQQQVKAIQELTDRLKTLQDNHSKLSDELNVVKKEKDEIRSECEQFKNVNDVNASITAELEQLKVSRDQIHSENEYLKSKENELFKRNEELHGTVQSLQNKIEEYERDNERLLSDVGKLCNEVESYKFQLNNKSEDMQKLINQATEKNSQLQNENTELNAKIASFEIREKDLDEYKKIMMNENQRLLQEVSTLMKSLDDMKEEQEKHISANQKQLFELMEEGHNMKEQLHILNNENSELRSKLDILTKEKSENDNEFLSKMEQAKEENKVLKEKVEGLQAAISTKEAEINSLTARCGELTQNEKMLTAESLKTIEEKVKEIDTLKGKIAEFENKITEQQSEIELLQESKDALQKLLQQSTDNSEIMDKTLVEESSRLQEANKKLEAQLDEALITFQAKETQMQIVNNELKCQADKLKDELKTNEEEQSMRLKQLVKEFQAQLQDKEEELQAALEKRFDRQQNYESDIIQQYKEQLKDFQVELTAKSEQIENLIIEKKEKENFKQEEIDHLKETIENIKQQHSDELKEVEKKWKVILMQRTDNLESKHEDEISELTREWQKERKNDTEDGVQELENTSRVAMAAVQSNTGSFHALQQTLASQRRELNELRKLLKLRHDTLEDSTEIEYLRNILFEYMMGRETMVLARVIAAVVKFDQEQTSKILKKEEDKLTLLGSLGLT